MCALKKAQGQVASGGSATFHIIASPVRRPASTALQQRRCNLRSMPASRTVRPCRAQKRCPSSRLSPPTPPPRFCEGLSVPPVALAGFGPCCSVGPFSVVRSGSWVRPSPLSAPFGPVSSLVGVGSRRSLSAPSRAGCIVSFFFVVCVPEWRLRAKLLGVQPREPRGLRGRANAP